MAQQLAPRPASAAAERTHSGAGEGARGTSAAAPPAALQLPGLQDVRGQWSGSVQAYGGGSSATSCDFDVKGQAWQWGSYGLDALVAAGSYHSEEGLQLQEVRGGACCWVVGVSRAKRAVRGRRCGPAAWLLPPLPPPGPTGLHPVAPPSIGSLCSRRATPSCWCGGRCWASARTRRCCSQTSQSPPCARSSGAWEAPGGGATWP